MYLVIAIGAAGAVIVVAALLALAVRALKAAHARPPAEAIAPDTHDQAHDQARGHDQGHDQGHGGSRLQRTLLSIVGKNIPRLLRLGVRMGPMMLLTVRGRSSGLPRTNPVDLFEANDRHWLVATHEANASWVRNLRAAGEGTLARGRRRDAFTAVELSQQAAGTVLKEVLGPRMTRPAAGFVLRQTLGVPPGASLEEFTAAAASHPVFEITLRRDGALAPTRTTAAPTPAEGDRMSIPATNAKKAPRIAIAVGLLVALALLALAVTGVTTAAQWTSGVVIGLLIVGVGNHFRIYGHR